VNIGHPVQDFPFQLIESNQAFVPVILQRARAYPKQPAYLAVSQKRVVPNGRAMRIYIVVYIGFYPVQVIEQFQYFGRPVI
jgi:hypothetical protein